MAENESLDRWIAVNGPMIETQFARREPASRRPADMPLTAAALEQITRPIVAALHPRRYALKNRERLNRLLMLLQLHVNGQDDVQAYAKTIRLGSKLTQADHRSGGARSPIQPPHLSPLT